MFDIDKLGLSWINYNKQGTTEFEEGTAEYYQNELLKGYLTLLTDKDTQQILHRSIDNDTKLLKDILEEIEENSNEREMPYNFYSLSTQTERKNDYITGKIGIGPFALNNNNHILTMLYGVKFKDIPGSIMSELGLTDLSKKEDFEHNSILSWISALINAHVDIAKDPYISILNVNPFTYNLVNTLIRTGFGKRTFYFTTQPIMKLLAKAYMNAQSAYMADPNKTQYTLQKEAITETAKSFFGEEELPFLKDVKFDVLSEHVYDNPGFSSIISDVFKQIVDQDVLRQNANRDFNDTVGIKIQYGEDKVELTPNQVQYVMYLGYLMMDPYAKSVSSLVKYSKIDTKKQGNNYVEQQLYKQGFEELFYGENAGALFEPEPLKRMANESYIGAKTRAAINVTADILKGHFLQATSGFNNARMMMLNMIGRNDSKDLKLNNKVSSAISAAIKSQIVNAYAEEMNADNPTYIRDLVNESFEENLHGHLKNSNNEMELSNDMKYKPSSYIGGQVTFKFVGISNDKITTGTNLGNGIFVTLATDLGGGKTEYTFTCPVLGANDDNNSIITNFQRATDTDVTVVRITGGKNTIYDRFNRLRIELSDNPDYVDVLDNSGEPRNMLLRSLIPGRTYEYSTPTIMPSVFTESPDTYSNLKFLKLFNALDNNGVESNYIIDAWDQLLHDTKHPALQKFAEDLVVYAFVTSGDKGGFTKFFKQVPLSWRKESGYGAQIQDWINDLTVGDISQEMLEDAILNNWFDNDFVRTYYLVDKDSKPQFVSYSGEVNNGYGVYNKTISFPIILAAIKQEPTDKEGEFKFTPTIDPDEAPLFIKIPRKINPNTKEGQRKFSVYKLQDIAAHRAADGSWVKYPVYVKVNPKGVELKGGYLMTEYGRDDSIRDERIANIESLEATYKVNDFISKQDLEQYNLNFSEAYSQTIEDLNYNYLRNKLGKEFDKKLVQFNNPVVQTEESQQEIEQTMQSTPNYYEGQIVPDANTVFVFGSNPEGRHGVGAAKVAREQFGAVYGQGEGLQGNSYAIPTKDLRIKENRSLRSISEKDIVKSISKMYDVARQHPDKQFKVAYRNGLRETTLNGYTGEELIGMFKSAGEIPQNVLFSKEWIDMWDSVPEDMYGEYTLAMNADDDYLYENMDEIYEYIETGRRSYKESRKLYELTRKVKSAIKSRFVTFLNKNGVSMDDIIIGKQTESFKNGKYVSVKLKEYSEEKFNKLIDKIKELTDGNTTYSYIVDGDKILVKDSDYDKFDVIEAEYEEFIYENVLNLYHMIQDEPSVEHAQSVLNGYSDMYSKDEIEEALGIYIKNFCERR